ncbi:hypothetical protein WJX72_005522 [[Myrmecia] bisecta]|uniref:Aminopeptidase N n=1 Tax=[Myrmecia] bisecta TaxID=41462 RepID=A0AAW1PX88_9CHLO
MAQPKTIYRRDYTPTPYLVDQVNLTFLLGEDVTRVQSKMQMRPNPNAPTNGANPAVLLNGSKDTKLVGVKVGGKDVPSSQYRVEPKLLTIEGVPAGEFELEIEVEIKPQENTALEGLYKSSGNFCTQCEAEGFRNITYFYDRPDVMAKYTTRIEADAKTYPVLLSNGNLIDSGSLDGDRHYAVWEDPFKKPCYLFALVAGNLAVHEDMFTTMSGREVVLRIFVEQKNLARVGFAMESLKKSMKWDEEVFGLEYDLDLFNIVAVDDFNMGAMENKSLNIFNSRLVLASSDTATDMDYSRIEGVVGHEYFHNWTGNRVTCRDWFQLTLKEGLTVFRDQEFSSDMNSRPVKRIEDVMRLRTAQFSEDAGPMAHPIRPDSYIKMDNFYTLTVYEKGAEIIRMYHTLLGKEGFRKGMDLYFERHDGQAVQCDDFLAAMADANSTDLSGIARWYGQAGTPTLTVSTSYNPSARTFTIHAAQATPPTNGQPNKVPVLIPFAVGLLGKDGHEIPLKLQGGERDLGTTAVLRLEHDEQTFTFTDVPEQPVPSLLRNFSAPVKLDYQGQTEADLVFLLAHDTDPFNRWEAGQRLAKNLLLKLYAAAMDTSKGASLEERVQSAGGVTSGFADAFKAVLTDKGLDGMFIAFATTLPASSELVDMIPNADPLVLHEVRKYVVKELAARLRPELEAILKATDSKPGEEYVFNAAEASRRALKNKALGYLAALGDAQITADVLRRFREAGNMTDKVAALASLADMEGEERETAMSEFYESWRDEPLVLLKWLALQAGSNAPGNLRQIKALLDHPAFNITNPNACYSVFLGFTRSAVNFHASDGSGYEFLGDSVLKVDKINRQVASRIAGAFTTWKQYDAERQTMMKAQLQRIVEAEGLSENVFEIVSKSLQEC